MSVHDLKWRWIMKRDGPFSGTHLYMASNSLGCFLVNSMNTFISMWLKCLLGYLSGLRFYSSPQYFVISWIWRIGESQRQNANYHIMRSVQRKMPKEGNLYAQCANPLRIYEQDWKNMAVLYHKPLRTSRNTTHNPWTSGLQFMEESSHIFLILDNTLWASDRYQWMKMHFQTVLRKMVIEQLTRN